MRTLRRLAGLLLLAPYIAVLLLPSATADHAFHEERLAAKAAGYRSASAASSAMSMPMRNMASASAPVLGVPQPSPFFMAGTAQSKSADVTEVCGVGLVKRGEDWGFTALQDAGDGESIRHWLERTASTADERTRIVAMRTLYQMHAEGGESEASAQWADRFIRAASESRDPAVYAMGIQVCSRADAVAACQLVSAEQWARIDPDNALPWLHAADLAARRKDDATQQAALFRASTAKRVRDYATLPMASLLSADQRGLRTSNALALAVFVTGVQAATPVPGGETLDQSCSAKAVEDANRRQVCAALADLFAREADAVFELGMAAKLGRRVGWPKERVDTVRERAASLTQLLVRLANPSDTLSCETWRGIQAHNIAAAEIGEVAALTRYSASPPPPR